MPISFFDGSLWWKSVHETWFSEHEIHVNFDLYSFNHFFISFRRCKVRFFVISLCFKYHDREFFFICCLVVILINRMEGIETEKRFRLKTGASGQNRTVFSSLPMKRNNHYTTEAYTFSWSEKPSFCDGQLHTGSYLEFTAFSFL